VRRHSESGERRLDVLRWGLVPNWTKDPAHALKPVNARSDTVTTSAMFRAQAFARQDGQPLAFAGLWESVRWPDGEILRTFAIITTEPSAEAAAIHDRMPLALRDADWPLWLGENDGDPATLLRPALEGTPRIWPILSPLGKGRPNDPELLDPLAALDL
jgi:putative SOS response-associated peptidase YedK